MEILPFFTVFSPLLVTYPSSWTGGFLAANATPPRRATAAAAPTVKTSNLRIRAPDSRDSSQTIRSGTTDGLRHVASAGCGPPGREQTHGVGQLADGPSR